ncbi:MAG: DUF6716 putative glycosyltransferase [Microbacterium sp.]|uniref:DUF6716 putative glycosyltransferase n=1 Tax=Microbacterium sp. TaxID=51671 RepID=UPI003F9DF280
MTSHDEIRVSGRTEHSGIGRNEPSVSGRNELSVIAIADADSFVKWSAALLDAVPGIQRHLLLVRTPLTVSDGQQQVALAGTGFREQDVTRIGYDELVGWLGGRLPDVVVLAGRGPFVRLVARQIDRLRRRPVVVSGLPGMSVPAQRGALDYRSESDLFVLHSHREQRAFAELGRRIGVSIPTALATLPYAVPASTQVVVEQRVVARELVRAGASSEVGDVVTRESSSPASIDSPVVGASPRGKRPHATDLVFAAQALVPAERSERETLAQMLRRAAEANPSRRVVIKMRSKPGEAETHLERDAYAELLERRPANLVFSYEPMATALARAEGLVTVSSTAAVEAIACGVPVIALDTFGVHKPLLNTVFVGSGLLGGAEEVIARRFRHPHPDWMRDNYFHAPDESTWWDRVEELVALRRGGQLPARTVPSARGGALHAAWHRKSVLGTVDRSLTGAVALGIGRPLVSGILSLRRAQGRTGEDTWADATTDFTLEPTPHRDPIRR